MLGDMRAAPFQMKICHSVGLNSELLAIPSDTDGATFDDLNRRRSIKDIIKRGFCENYKKHLEYLETGHFLIMQTNMQGSTTILRKVNLT